MSIVTERISASSKDELSPSTSIDPDREEEYEMEAHARNTQIEDIPSIPHERNNESESEKKSPPFDNYENQQNHMETHLQSQQVRLQENVATGSPFNTICVEEFLRGLSAMSGEIQAKVTGVHNGTVTRSPKRRKIPAGNAIKRVPLARNKVFETGDLSKSTESSKKKSLQSHFVSDTNNGRELAPNLSLGLNTEFVELMNSLNMNLVNTTCTTDMLARDPNSDSADILSFYASLVELARISANDESTPGSIVSKDCEEINRFNSMEILNNEERQRIGIQQDLQHLHQSQQSEIRPIQNAKTQIHPAVVENDVTQFAQMLATLVATGGTETDLSAALLTPTALPVDERVNLCCENFLQAMTSGFTQKTTNQNHQYTQQQHAKLIGEFGEQVTPSKSHFSSSASSSALSSPAAGSAASSSARDNHPINLTRHSVVSRQSVDSGIGAQPTSTENGGALIAAALLDALANAQSAPAALALLAADSDMQRAFAEYVGAIGAPTTASVMHCTLETEERDKCITEDMMRAALTQALKSSADPKHLDLAEIIKHSKQNTPSADHTLSVSAAAWRAANENRPQSNDYVNRHYDNSNHQEDANYGILTSSTNRARITSYNTQKNGSTNMPTLASVLEERRRKRPRTTSKNGSNVSNVASPGQATGSAANHMGLGCTITTGSPVLKNVLAAVAAASIKNVSNALSSAKPHATTSDEHTDNINNAAAAATAAAAAAIGCTGAEFLELAELEEFANFFKKQRIKHGFTQGDVGVALGKRYGTDFSQTTISRFEALNLSYKNMCKLRPLLKEWLEEAETMIENGATVVDILEAPAPNFAGISLGIPSGGSCSSTELNGAEWGEGGDANATRLITINSANGTPLIPPLKRRRKRTNLDNAQKAALDIHFDANPRPDHQRMNEIASLLELDPDVVRVWFCNRRQKLRKIC